MIPALAAVPFTVAVLLHLGARTVVDRLSPAVATWLLTVSTLSVSLTCGLVLSCAGYVSLAQLSVAAHVGHWSAPALRHAGSLPLPLGVVLAGVVVALLAAATWHTACTVRAFLNARSTVAHLPGSHASLVVVDDPVPSAFAVAGLPGRIVVSSGMLGALSTQERQVLLAHEEAHLRHRHHVFVWVTAVAAAANPLLRPMPALVRASIERWADESAVRRVGDRTAVARGVARAALMRAGARTVAGAIGIADGEVVTRVRALLEPARPARRGWALLLAAAVVVAWLATVLVLRNGETMIEFGESAYRR